MHKGHSINNRYFLKKSKINIFFRICLHKYEHFV